MNIIDRVFKNWKTSLVGMLILGGSLAAVFTGKATLTEAGAFMVMGLGFFFLKDRGQGTPPAALLLIGLLLVSCGANYHLKRSKYHLAQAIAKGAEVKTDTVYKDVQVVTERVLHDTLVRRDVLHDTLVIKHTKYQVRLKYDTLTRTEYVQVDCKPDTVTVRVPVKVETKITPYNLPMSVYAMGLVFILIIIALIIYASKLK